MNKNFINVALIGIGGWAGITADAIMRSKKVKLSSCFTRNKENRVKFAKKYNAIPADSYEEILSDKEIDGIIIETPNFIHKEQALLAGEYGKNVFIDKPITNSVKEAKEIIKLFKEKNLVLSVGHNTRRRAAHRKIKELIKTDKIGKVVMVEANFSHAGGFSIKEGDWRWYEKKCPGGPLIQLGVHHTDTLQYLLGDIIKVTSIKNNVVLKTEIPDVVMTLLEFESGVLGYLGTNYATPLTFYINVYGTKANLFSYVGTELWIQDVTSAKKEKIELEEVDDFLEEIDEFADAILYKKKVEVGGEEALKALAVIEASVISYRENKSILVEDILKNEN